MLDLFGHAGYILLIAGSLLLAKQFRIGWAFRFLGSLVWVVLGYFMGYSSIIIWSAVFTITDAYGWFKWGKQDEEAPILSDS